MKRRTWLLSAAGTTGALVVGWSALPARSRLGTASSLRLQADITSGATGIALNGWIKVTPQGRVVLAMPRSEMGQGAHTALAMLAAEELDVALSQVSLEQAPQEAIFGNVAMFVATLPFHPRETDTSTQATADARPTKVKVGEWMVAKVARELGINVTGGSSSVADAWEVVRMAAATARASLLGAAALNWRLPIGELTVADGVVSHASGPSAHYGEFVKLAAAGPMPGNVLLKSPQDRKLIGRALPRLDVPAKVDGTARFGLDVRLPGMVYAAIRQCPMLGGAPGAIDVDAVLASPGVERVVRLPGIAGSTAGFAVVGKTWWHAQEAARAARVQWQQRPAGALDTALIEQASYAALDAEPGSTFFEKGDIPKAEGVAVRSVTARYHAPYLAHATLEPMNCTAQVEGGKVKLWTGTQVPGMAVAVAAEIAGVATKDVEITVMLLGGGFGRRLEVDVIGQAVRVAMECGGRPVQLIWSREEDQTHDFYRPMQAADMRASIDAKGQITSLRIKSAGDPISPRWMSRGIPHLTTRLEVPDKTASEGLFDLPYEFAHQNVSHVATHQGVPVGFWRSVGHSHNAFFSEGFIDELAVETMTDPVAFRRTLLKYAPRHRAVLDLAASKAGWGQPLAPGRARGVALHESFGSIVVQVAEVSIAQGRIEVHRVICAIDCGTVVNPNIVAQQMEGAVAFALTAALYGRIDIRSSVVQQNNFARYPMLSLREAPRVETHIVESDRWPGGVGEPGVPPIAPAVAGALYALTKTRQRRLPLSI
jgi:isoquinoline 1-oxidoreductase subunit beta